MYSEIYQPLVKEVEGNRKRWENIACAWTGRINTLKITILPKTIYRFNAIPIRIPKSFHRTWKSNLKICIETQRSQIAKTILRKNRAGSNTQLDFRLYCKVKVIKENRTRAKTDTKIPRIE